MAKSWNVLSFWLRTKKDNSDYKFLTSSKMTFGEFKEKLKEAGEKVSIKDSDTIEFTVFPNTSDNENAPNYKLSIKVNNYAKK